ncbi:hypothetical protein GQ53DRAFT_16504 [Thozetella sp. PMI_491]|nr:hypothetical protein GQ53DRAFT_16504 [Thozetella sp. PMI_491]
MRLAFLAFTSHLGPGTEPRRRTTVGQSPSSSPSSSAYTARPMEIHNLSPSKLIAGRFPASNGLNKFSGAPTGRPAPMTQNQRRVAVTLAGSASHLPAYCFLSRHTASLAPASLAAGVPAAYSTLLLSPPRYPVASQPRRRRIEKGAK